MCPTLRQWKGYGVTYRAPGPDQRGNLVETPRITVCDNGVLVYKDLELAYSDSAAKMRRAIRESRKVSRIKRQNRRYLVEYRNI
jgi:hypothetical protein